jgi:translocation and assembly module TamB
VRVVVNAPRNLWVRGNDANLELGLGPKFVVSVTDKPRIFGEVQVRRGRVAVLGRRFDLDRQSTVRFSGPSDRPTLDVKATHVNDRITPPVSIVVTAKGPIDRLALSLTSPSHPQLNETQMYTVLITGRLDLAQPSSGASTPEAQAASLIGGLLASRLQKTLARKLPLDVLTIESGDGLGGTSLEAGTYLTDDLYVAYLGRLATDPFRRQNRNEVRLEYQLTARWSFEGMYGDAKVGSADLVWTKHY